MLEGGINFLNIQSSKRNNLFGIRQYSGGINGREETASKLVTLLEKATLQENLKFLTLLSWSEIFPRKKLVKTTRFWCPFCYQDFIAQNQPVYEPLIWSVNVIVTCSKHKTPLNSCCHHCDRALPLLSSNSRVGFCSKCGKWLGKDIKEKTQNYQRYGKDEIQWNHFVNENIEKLISVSHRLNKPISRHLLAKSFNLYIERLTKGNIAAFARMFKIPKNSVWMWSKGKTIPQIDTLLNICYFLNISILDFLAIDRSSLIYNRQICLNNIKSQKCQRINKRKIQIDSEYLEKYLQDILINRELILSVTEIADRLGYDRQVLTRKFPQLCQQISQKYLANKQLNSQQKIKSYCLEVEAIAKKLYLQGIYPSEVAVSQHLDKPGYFRYKKVRNALKHFQDSLV